MSPAPNRLASVLGAAGLLMNAAPAAARHGVKSVEVGPIMNQWDAERKCPAAAKKAGGTWNGQWRTTRPMQMSECDVKMDSAGWLGGHKVKAVEAGPIMSNWDAQRKCPEVAKNAGGTWTGDWRTTRPGMSECDIKK